MSRDVTVRVICPLAGSAGDQPAGGDGLVLDECQACGRFVLLPAGELPASPRVLCTECGASP